MEKLKVKHDHELTDIVKVCLFGIFLILPILMFLPSCIYYAFNEHAQVGTKQVENYKKIELKQYIYNGKPNTLNYIYNNGDGSMTISNNYLKYEGGENFSIYFDVAYLNANLNDKLLFTFESYDNGNYDYDLYLSGNHEITIAEPETFSTSNTKYQFLITNDYTTTYESIIFMNDGIYDELFIKNVMIFNLTEMYGIGNEPTIEKFNETWAEEYYNYNETYAVEIPDGTYTSRLAISDEIEYQWQNIWTLPVYKWVNTNNFKFTINAFVNVFGMTESSYIPSYLTYILVITAIYVVLDIVLTMFKLVTHIFNGKN